jgi:oligopeptide/dipeptide ABC transporter ATP-binding protein
MNILLELDGIEKRFRLRGTGSEIQALRGVSLKVHEGETLGIVGESGCGKSTLARVLMRLVAPSAGSIVFEGTDMTHLSEAQLRPIRRRMQMVFQDPFASLDPRMTVGQQIEEPLLIHRVGDKPARRARVAELLGMVGLDPQAAGRYPHEFSGGQRQRICIARAVALEPRLLVCDEAVSALDVSVQSQILNLISELRTVLGLTCIFIAHDLTVVKYISDTVMVMYLGKAVEIGPVDAIFSNPLHPYTQALLAAIPVPDPDAPRNARPLDGELPSPERPPGGCAFHPRCPFAMDVCRAQEPGLSAPAAAAGVAHRVACHLHADGHEASLAERPSGGVTALV